MLERDFEQLAAYGRNMLVQKGTTEALAKIATRLNISLQDLLIALVDEKFIPFVAVSEEVS